MREVWVVWVVSRVPEVTVTKGGSRGGGRGRGVRRGALGGGRGARRGRGRGRGWGRGRGRRTRGERDVREGQGLGRAFGRAGAREAGAVRVRVFAARGRSEGGSDLPLGDPLGEEHHAGRAARFPALVVVRLLGPVLRGSGAPRHLRALLGGQGLPRLRLRQLGLRSQRHRTCGATRRPRAPQ